MSATSCCHVFGDGSAALMVRSVKPFTVPVPSVATLSAVLPFVAANPPATATNPSPEADSAELDVVDVIAANAVPPLGAAGSDIAVAVATANALSLILWAHISPAVTSGGACSAIADNATGVALELLMLSAPAWAAAELTPSLSGPVPLATVDARGSGSVIGGPPWPLLENPKSDAMYWPNRTRFAVSEPSLVVSVVPKALSWFE